MKKILAFSIVLFLAGCAALGVPPANTFNKRTVVANSMIEASAKVVVRLYEAGKITAADANKQTENLQLAADTVDGAILIYKSDPQEAETRLGAVILSLQALENYLRSKQ